MVVAVLLIDLVLQGELPEVSELFGEKIVLSLAQMFHK
jgi:hypothetical protein